MAERRYSHLNVTVLAHINRALEDDPAADLEATLSKLCTSYAKIRRSIEAREAKRRTESSEPLVPLQAGEPDKAPPRVLEYLASTSKPRPAASRQISAGCLAPLPSIHFPFPCPLPHSIIYPLSPVVCQLLEIWDASVSDLSATIVGHALSGTLLWEHSVRAVIQIGENVVVKVAQSQYFNHDEHGVLQFVEEHFPSIAAPRALGLVTVGSTSFMFMTLVPGTTLEKRWPSLSAETKLRIRDLLDETVATFRQLESPCGAPLGSPVGRRLCKDVRRDDRVSASSLYSEAQFNDFLLESRSCRAAPNYKRWLRSMLSDDHRIVFTHADLHQGNVMVVDGPDGGVELSGIIDWESSGFYPEYWEHLKALNTRSIQDESDWWDFLPPSILGYDREVVLDRVIESTVVY
ncbi:kinase-like domain-containing protein [Fomitopsis serialis]|uniref:kinase-like domain-containing protein n=1 Tax=Fomitopsis serialis TaxID=139415 RepID=UPI0020076400|nr:kinase-like domain-containing protein [Neoantrodia serialis]KAH9917993.1 kinase-like domain-containing protein [Neoantrodia serialis]